MKLENELKKCLRFDTPNILESNIESLIRKAISKLAAYKEVTTGWDGYAWKNGEYIDDIQEYFDSKLEETDI